MALEEMALFLFMISSNSASLRGVRDDSMSLQIHTGTPHVLSELKRDTFFCSQCKWPSKKYKTTHSYVCNSYQKRIFKILYLFVSPPLAILTGLQDHNPPSHMVAGVRMGHLVQGALGCHLEACCCSQVEERKQG